MRYTSFAALALASLLGMSAPALAQSASAPTASVSAALDAALAGSHRAPENRGRDAHRNPKETLAFFGLQPNMTVVEIAPGGGWYTEVLAPVLKDQGRLIAAHNDPNSSTYGRRALGGYLLKLGNAPDVYGKVEIAPFNPAQNLLGVAPGTADMVLTFRNVHNWMGSNSAEAAFKLFFNALKPGGVLGVTEHRWPEDRAVNPRSGYVKESDVIRLAEAAGFKLAARSEINANPRDTKDYPKGVWTLPPSFAEGAQDRGRYATIGESDRMTLKFVKP